MTADISVIIDQAYERAADAGFAHPFCLNDNGDCGGAYVVVAGRHRKLRAALENKGCSRVFPHHAGGYGVTVFAGWNGQSRAVYEAAARAFADTLTEHGFDAHVHSYAD